MLNQFLTSKKLKVAFILFSCIYILISCSSDKEDLGGGNNNNNNNNNNNCQTTNVTFASTINGILNSNGCFGCHGAAPTAPFSLQGYVNVKAKVDDGRLWGAINHLAGFVPMPQGGGKMSSCDISKIKAWIDAGAPNN